MRKAINHVIGVERNVDPGYEDLSLVELDPTNCLLTVVGGEGVDGGIDVKQVGRGDR